MGFPSGSSNWICLPAGPASTRYRFLEGCPNRIAYRSDRVKISVRADLDHCWMTYATRESDPTSHLEIFRRETQLLWAEVRFSGFDVPTGSPPEKITQCW